MDPLETEGCLVRKEFVDHLDKLVQLDQRDIRDKEEIVDMAKRERGENQDTAVAVVFGFELNHVTLHAIVDEDVIQNLVMLVTFQALLEWFTQGGGRPPAQKTQQRLFIREQLQAA